MPIIETTTSMEGIFEEVRKERFNEDEKYGEQNHDPAYWIAVLGKEFGSICRAICENNPEKYRKELIDLLAVGTNMAETFDRGVW